MGKNAPNKNGIEKRLCFLFAIVIESVFLWIVFFTSIRDYIGILTIINRMLAVLLVVLIYSQNKSPSIKMPWIMLMMVVPIVGISYTC